MFLCSRHFMIRSKLSIATCQRYFSSKSQRPFPTLSEKEQLIIKAKKLSEEAPTQTRVKVWWHTFPNYKKFVLFSSVGCLAYLYLSWCYRLYKTSQEKVTNQPRMYGELNVGGPFELVDTKGTTISSETLKGNWVLLYFGFTYCPDICPEQMELMGDVVDIAKKDHNIDVTPLMITIDLERDTPDVLEEYVNEYNPKIIGLLGTEQQIDDVCNAYRCYRSKGQAYDDPNDYILDHTVTQYLINPNGKCVGYFMSNRGLDDRVKILLDHVTNYDALNSVSDSNNSIFSSLKQYLGLDT